VNVAESPDCVPFIVSSPSAPVKLLEPGFWSIVNVPGNCSPAHALVVHVSTTDHEPLKGGTLVAAALELGATRADRPVAPGADVTTTTSTARTTLATDKRRTRAEERKRPIAVVLLSRAATVLDAPLALMPDPLVARPAAPVLNATPALYARQPRIIAILTN